jgi:hypothetical protein
VVDVDDVMRTFLLPAKLRLSLASSTSRPPSLLSRVHCLHRVFRGVLSDSSESARASSLGCVGPLGVVCNVCCLPR